MVRISDSGPVEIRLNAFRWSTIPQIQFIIINDWKYIIVESFSSEIRKYLRYEERHGFVSLKDGTEFILKAYFYLELVSTYLSCFRT